MSEQAEQLVREIVGRLDLTPEIADSTVRGVLRGDPQVTRGLLQDILFPGEVGSYPKERLLQAIAQAEKTYGWPLGSEPKNWELSNEDRAAYQNRLAAHTIARLATIGGLNQQRLDAENYRKDMESWPQAKRESTVSLPSREYFHDGKAYLNPSESVGGVPLLPEEAYQAGIARAVGDYRKAYGPEAGRYASGFFGSVYPWHQGSGAVVDAVSSVNSPIGKYMRIMNIPYGGIMGALTGETDPVGNALSEYTSGAKYGGVNPVVPGSTPEDRAEIISKGRASNQQLMPTSLGHADYARTGQPSSWGWDAVRTTLAALTDFSTAVSPFASPLVRATASGARAVGVAPKLASSMVAARQPLSLARVPGVVAKDAASEVPLTGALLAPGLGQAPPVSRMLSPGIENRPDIQQEFPTRDDAIKAYKRHHNEQDMARGIEEQRYVKENPSPAGDAAGWLFGNLLGGLESAARTNSGKYPLFIGR